MSRVRGDTIIDEVNLTVPVHYDIMLDGYPRLAVQATFTDSTPGAKGFADTDVDIITDKIDIVAHGFNTGLKVQFTTLGTLPSGLSLLTDYWIIRWNADQFKVAASYADALNTVALPLNSQGSGPHAVVPATLSGGTIKGQSSVDGANFVDVTPLLAKTDTAGTAIFNVVEPAYRWLRILFTPGSGSINLKVILNAHDALVGTPALSAQ